MQEPLYDFMLLVEADLKQFLRGSAFDDILKTYPAERVINYLWETHRRSKIDFDDIDDCVRKAIISVGPREIENFLNTLPSPRRKAFEIFIGHVDAFLAEELHVPLSHSLQLAFVIFLIEMRWFSFLQNENEHPLFREEFDFNDPIKFYTFIMNEFSFESLKLWALEKRAEAHGKLGNHLARFKDLSQILSLNPDSSLAKQQREDIYKQKIENTDSAINVLSEIIEKNPDDVWAYDKRGVKYFIVKNYTLALQDAAEITRINPNSTLGYIQCAECHFQIGDFEALVEDYTRLINSKYQLHETFKSRALIYIKLGRVTEAIADLTKIIELDSKNLWALEERAKLNAKTNNMMALDEDVIEILKRGGSWNMDYHYEPKNSEKIKILVEVGKPSEATKILLALANDLMTNCVHVSYRVDFFVNALRLFLDKHYFNESIDLLDSFFSHISIYFDFPDSWDNAQRDRVFNKMEKILDELRSKKSELNAESASTLEKLCKRFSTRLLKADVEEKGERGKIFKIRELLEEVMNEGISRNPHVNSRNLYSIPLSYKDDALGKLSQHTVDKIESWINEKKSAPCVGKLYDPKIIEWTEKFIDIFKNPEAPVPLTSKPAVKKAYELRIGFHRQSHGIKGEERHSAEELLKHCRHPDMVLPTALMFIESDKKTQEMSASEYVSQYGYGHIEIIDIFCQLHRYNEAILLLQNLFSRASHYFDFPQEENDFFRLLFFNDLQEKMNDLLKKIKEIPSDNCKNCIEMLESFIFKHKKYAYKAKLDKVSRKHDGYFSESVNTAIKALGWSDKFFCRLAHSAHAVVEECPSYFDEEGETYQDLMQLTQVGSGKIKDNYKRIGMFSQPALPSIVNQSNSVCAVGSGP